MANLNPNRPNNPNTPPKADAQTRPDQRNTQGRSREADGKLKGHAREPRQPRR